MRVFQLTADLPEKYSALVGSIVTRWSIQERLLADLTYALLNIDLKRGRIAVRSPRANEHIVMIKQLMSLDGIQCDSIDLDKLAEQLRALESIRDLVAHGLWFVEPKTKLPAVRNTAGHWKPDPKGPKVSRRIKPEAVVFDTSSFGNILDAIEKTIRETMAAHVEITKKLQASRRKSP